MPLPIGVDAKEIGCPIGFEEGVDIENLHTHRLDDRATIGTRGDTVYACRWVKRFPALPLADIAFLS